LSVLENGTGSGFCTSVYVRLVLNLSLFWLWFVGLVLKF